MDALAATQNQKPAYVLGESVALAALGCADMVLTLVLIALGRAYEANPLMAAVLDRGGVVAFVAVKTASLMVPIAAAEWLRARKPEFVRRMMRLALGLYAAVYAIATLGLNL